VFSALNFGPSPHTLPLTPLVSILIPAYNSEAWIRESIESALAQTWRRKEIIVVDDGSTDETLALASQFATKDVSVVSETHQGASATRNTAFSLCQGDYIQWLDADDLLANDKIERQLKVVENQPGARTLLSGAWGLFSYRVHRARYMPTALWRDLAPLEWLLLKMGQNLQMQPDAWLVSRELTEAAGPWNVRLHRDNDGEYFCRVILASQLVRFVPEAKSFYRFTGFNSISHVGRTEKKLESLFLSIQLHVRYLLSLEDSARTRAACLKFLQTWLVGFYPFRMDLVRQSEQLAESLGGRLEAPRMSWEYDWIRAAFGWRAAKETQMLFNKLKHNSLVGFDRVLSRLGSGHQTDET
jgi:glycosyltransferase involved in cell wall biosynthesis